LLAQIIIQKVILYSVDGSIGFNRDLFETRPNKNGTTDMVPYNSCFPALVTFDTSQLLGFTVELWVKNVSATNAVYISMVSLTVMKIVGG